MPSTLPDSHLRGLNELDRKLAELGAKTGARVLRASARAALLPVLKDAKATIPEGDAPHYTYKRRLVAPGFAKRSLRRITKIERGRVVALLGVAKEAFYAVHFWEYGTPRIPRAPWLGMTLERNADEVTRLIGHEVRKRILKVAKKKGAAKK